MIAPAELPPTSARLRYTQRGNLRATRYGWLRLTPAYSLHLVRELVSTRGDAGGPVLDPFCGTGTTLLVCTELGLDCDTLDLNPFLVWLASAKSRSYSARERSAAAALGERALTAVLRGRSRTAWRPALHNIERWWPPDTLAALARAFEVLRAETASKAAVNLCKLAFCRALIDSSNASFNHQSLSFKAPGTVTGGARPVAEAFERALASVIGAAGKLPRTRRAARLGDARALSAALDQRRYRTVITSPPYPNRMSYIRELRPYMYWLGYLDDGRAAGELDWRLIGGTWGTATSRVGKWQAPSRQEDLLPELSPVLGAIGRQSELLSRYVAKYFHDMALHVSGLPAVLEPGAEAHYVIGNSKFYDVLLPAERLLASLFERTGFRDVRLQTLRKRTSKAELFEYLVSARI